MHSYKQRETELEHCDYSYKILILQNDFNIYFVRSFTYHFEKELLTFSHVLTGQMFIVSCVVAVTVGLASTMAPTLLLNDTSAAAKFGFLSYVTGNYLAPQNCKVEFDWKDPCIVGSTVSFTIRVSFERELFGFCIY